VALGTRDGRTATEPRTPPNGTAQSTGASSLQARVNSDASRTASCQPLHQVVSTLAKRE